MVYELPRASICKYLRLVSVQSVRTELITADTEGETEQLSRRPFEGRGHAERKACAMAA